jgi:hypothetical protein
MAVAKKVRVKFHLSATTRMICTKVRDVDKSIAHNSRRLKRLIDEVYADAKGQNFMPDPDWWEQGECSAEIIDESPRRESKYRRSLDPKICRSSALDLLNDLAHFEVECEENNGTEIDDAWTMIYALRDELEAQLEVNKPKGK